MVDLGDPQTAALSMTNLALGIGVVVCFVIVLYEVLWELLFPPEAE